MSEGLGHISTCAIQSGLELRVASLGVKLYLLCPKLGGLFCKARKIGVNL